MKALVIGGTQGFGGMVTEELRTLNYEVITVGRSGNPDYLCDVGDIEKWKEVAAIIKNTHSIFNLIIFVVGYARAKSSKDLTVGDWQENINRNFLYVTVGLQELESSLKENGRVVTVGSQWSYKVGNDELVPYTVSKHALYTFTKDFAVQNPSVKANHYCMPTMDTPQYAEVMISFKEIEKAFPAKEVADPSIVAKGFVRHLVQFNETAKMLKIDKDGSVHEIQQFQT